MSRIGRLWLKTELPELVQQEIIPDDVAQRIRDHYAAGEAGRIPLALAICGGLGAILIGLGIILLFAHNWEELSRPVRSVLAFAPLLVGQALVAYTLLKKPNSTAWVEGSASFLALMVGACIALIAQTYQIPGNIGSFVLLWALLGLPIMYVVDTRLCAALYVVAVTTWAGYQQGDGRTALWIWGLLALAVPYLYRVYRAERAGARVALLSWTVASCICFDLGFTLEHSMPGLWIPIYASLFAAMYLAGRSDAVEGIFGWRKPYSIVGVGGTAILALILTYEDPWEKIGWSHARTAESLYTGSAIANYITLAVLLGLAMTLLIRRLRAGLNEDLLVGLAPIAVAVAYLIGAMGRFEVPAAILMNVYMFGLGIGMAVLGLRSMRLLLVNGGLFILGAWIVARFFDLDVGFFVRGVMFIILGVLFLSINFIIVRRQQKEATP